jgi:D-alanyl-lipoteichoic acid acyltransferase DltB (MBOAT superfamily)
VLFNSLTFLVFFTVVLFFHRLPLPWTVKKANLLVASYVFYAAWNPPFVVLLWISTVTDWYVARGIARSAAMARRRALLVVSLVVNLGLLGYFKYAGFLLENMVWMLRFAGIDFEPAAPDIILPLGISFYTFQTLSYSIAVYRRDAEPSSSFLDYALFVTFFPQLVAGPIVRSGDLLPQFATPRQANARQLGWGLVLFTFGIFEKVVLADCLLAPTADLVYGEPSKAGALDAWIGTLAFSGQIFFDFAGYSLCAIGTASCLGFRVPDNFQYPYASLGFSDFWRRWHVSLSSWLRDYLYISLGGNRIGVSRTYVNLMLTMLIGGLWHGASWHFVVWGALHGAYLVMERWSWRFMAAATAVRSQFTRLLVAGFTFVTVTVTWSFFRAGSFGDAAHIMAVMFNGAPAGLVSNASMVQVGAVIVVTFAVQCWLRDADLEQRFTNLPLVARSMFLVGLLVSILLAPGDDRAFIYFRF